MKLGITTSGLRRIAQTQEKYIWDFGGDVVGSSQYNGWLTAYDAETRKGIGYIEYAIYDGEFNIQMIEVAPEYRRQGVATDLLSEALKREDMEQGDVVWGMTTPEGTAFKDAVNPSRVSAINDDCVDGGEEICKHYNDTEGYPKCFKSLEVSPFKVWWRNTATWRDLDPHVGTKDYDTVASWEGKAGICHINGVSDCVDTGCPYWER